MVLWFLCPRAPIGLPAVVMILKGLRRLCHSLKSPPTDWEKPEIEPATPGLQGIGLSPTPLLKTKTSCFQSLRCCIYHVDKC